MSEPPHNAIAVGDCLESMAAWPEDRVDLVFADPPYNIGYGCDQYEDNRDDAEYVEWTCDWIDGCARLLKPSGSLYILIGDEYAAETRVHLKQLERDGQLVFRNWIVWHYTFGQNCKAKFNRSHAHLFYCVGSAALGKWKVSDPPFTFNRDWLGCEMSDEYAAKATERIEHAAATGEAVQTSLDDKGIECGKPRKKAEPHRSPHLRKRGKNTATATQ